MRLLSKAVDQLGLEWTPPKEPAPNRLNSCFLQRHRKAPPSRSAPFLPELSEALWSFTKLDGSLPPHY